MVSVTNDADGNQDNHPKYQKVPSHHHFLELFAGFARACLRQRMVSTSWPSDGYHLLPQTRWMKPRRPPASACQLPTPWGITFYTSEHLSLPDHSCSLPARQWKPLDLFHSDPLSSSLDIPDELPHCAVLSKWVHLMLVVVTKKPYMPYSSVVITVTRVHLHSSVISMFIFHFISSSEVELENICHWSEIWTDEIHQYNYGVMPSLFFLQQNGVCLI